jgi:hypothetical protein
MLLKILPRYIFNGFLMLLVCSVLPNCAGSRLIDQQDLAIEMEKTPCYGQCPVYTIKIDKKGKGLFVGNENTGKIGTYSFRLTRAELAELAQSFAEIRFFYLEDRYYEHISDLPTTWLSYQAGGQFKKIMDYYGAPQELKDLEKQIESLVLAKKMKKIR